MGEQRFLSRRGWPTSSGARARAAVASSPHSPPLAPVRPAPSSWPLDPPAQPRSQLRRRLVTLAHALCLLATLTLGGALRFWNLGALSLGLHEARAVSIARLPWRETFAYLNPLDATAPGYHVALHAWMTVAGQSEVSVRSLSAAAGVATIMVLYLIVARLVSRNTAQAAATLLAVSPTHIFWSRVVSPWALVCLLMCIQVLQMLGALRHPRQVWRWAALGVGNGLLLYTHYAALAMIATLTVMGALTLRNRRYELACLWSSTLLPVAALVPTVIARWRDLTLALPGAAAAPTVSALLQTMTYLFAWNSPTPLIALLTLPGVGVALLGSLALFRLERIRAAGLLIIWLVGAPSLLFIAAYVTGVYSTRVALSSLPALVTLLAVGAGMIGRRARHDVRRSTRRWTIPLLRRSAARAGFAAAFGLTMLSLIALSAISDATYYTTYQTEPWRQLVAQAQAQEQPGDLILLANPSGYTEPAFDYYYTRGPQARGLQLPRHAIPVDWSPTSTGQTTLDTQAAVARLTALLHGRQRVWIVIREDDNAAWAQSLLDLMPPWYTQVSSTTFTSGEAPLTLSLWTTSTVTSGGAPAAAAVPATRSRGRV